RKASGVYGQCMYFITQVASEIYSTVGGIETSAKSEYDFFLHSNSINSAPRPGRIMRQGRSEPAKLTSYLVYQKKRLRMPFSCPSDFFFLPLSSTNCLKRVHLSNSLKLLAN